MVYICKCGNDLTEIRKEAQKELLEEMTLNCKNELELRTFIRKELMRFTNN